MDLDTKRILAFQLTYMNGGDAANLVKLLGGIMRAYTGKGIPMNESLSDMVLEIYRTAKLQRQKRKSCGKTHSTIPVLRGCCTPSVGVAGRYNGGKSFHGTFTMLDEKHSMIDDKTRFWPAGRASPNKGLPAGFASQCGKSPACTHTVTVYRFIIPKGIAVADRRAACTRPNTITFA